MSARWIHHTDTTAWREALDAHVAAGGEPVDVYALAGFAAAAVPDGDAWLLDVQTERARMLVPLCVRPLPAHVNMPDARDAESPGYAGVLYAGDPHDGPACFEALRNALSERRIAALFLRLSPFGHPPAVAPHLLAFEHPTVYVPLEHGYAHAFEGASCANHRTKVRRAQKNGFRVVLTEQPEPDALDAFRGLYTATMERLSATNEYHYPRGYYTSLARDLGPRIALAYATHDDAPGMHYAVLLLRGDRHAHYHLGARREDVDPTAGNLVFDAAAQWAAGHGLAALHLGGGTTPSRDDSLYAFKSRIARGETALRCAGVVADRALYDALVQRWSALGGTKPRWFLTWRQPIAAQASSIEVSV